MERVCQTLGVSERRACRVLRQYRSAQRHRTLTPQDEPRLVTRTLQLAGEYGRYGYRRITALLRREGWRVNHKRVERIWRQEGLKVPKKQPRKGRLWLNDGSCLRLRPCWRDHVWAYDFVADRTHDGRPLKILTVVDEDGSSPRLRGTARLTHAQIGITQFIPAPAGNRYLGVVAQLDPIGSSPRLRGTVRTVPANRLPARFIPAPAGNRRSQSEFPPWTPVHPRACGEQVPERRGVMNLDGSSPRLRGTA